MNKLKLSLLGAAFLLAAQGLSAYDVFVLNLAGERFFVGVDQKDESGFTVYTAVEKDEGGRFGEIEKGAVVSYKLGNSEEEACPLQNLTSDNVLVVFPDLSCETVLVENLKTRFSQEKDEQLEAIVRQALDKAVEKCPEGDKQLETFTKQAKAEAMSQTPDEMLAKFKKAVNFLLKKEGYNPLEDKLEVAHRRNQIAYELSNDEELELQAIVEMRIHEANEKKREEKLSDFNPDMTPGQFKKASK